MFDIVSYLEDGAQGFIKLFSGLFRYTSTGNLADYLIFIGNILLFFGSITAILGLIGSGISVASKSFKNSRR